MGEFVKSGHVEPSICVMCFAHKDTCDQFFTKFNFTLGVWTRIRGIKMRSDTWKGDTLGSCPENWRHNHHSFMSLPSYI